VSKYNLTLIKFSNKLIPNNIMRRNIMGDILKEAIADAKAVRETALENAKMALEEAFTPQIKSMLSAKLKEDEHEDEESEEGMHDEDMDDDEGDAEEGYHEDDEMGDEDEVEVPAEDAHVDDEAEEDAHEGEHDDEAEEGHGDDDEVEESNLDLEAIIRELEAELTEDEDEDDAEEEGVYESEESVEESEEPVEEEYEIDEVAITEEEDDEDEKEVEESNTSAVEAELKEYKEAVVFLKDKLHEVNILNAKLLFTNKLFKSYSLDNNQKLKVVETFDRAQTTREIKLVYSTLAEQFQDNGSIITKKSIKESASTAVSSTKPSKESRKVISEEVEVANRFKKLAGLL
jgi:hypothetical protein